MDKTFCYHKLLRLRSTSASPKGIPASSNYRTSSRHLIILNKVAVSFNTRRAKAPTLPASKHLVDQTWVTSNLVHHSRCNQKKRSRLRFQANSKRISYFQHLPRKRWIKVSTTRSFRSMQRSRRLRLSSSIWKIICSNSWHGARKVTVQRRRAKASSLVQPLSQYQLASIRETQQTWQQRKADLRPCKARSRPFTWRWRMIAVR